MSTSFLPEAHRNIRACSETVPVQSCCQIKPKYSVLQVHSPTFVDTAFGYAFISVSINYLQLYNKMVFCLLAHLLSQPEHVDVSILGHGKGRYISCSALIVLVGVNTSCQGKTKGEEGCLTLWTNTGSVSC